MTYALLIGQRSYSSWSLRGWLSFALFDIPVTVSHAVIYDASFADTVASFGGHGTVPVVRTPEGAVLRDSLSIAWHLAERFEEKGLLPAAGAARAEAMNMIAEMHSGFTALRSDCPMNLRNAWDGYRPDEAVQADVARIDALWSGALAASGGPWLFGAPSLADVFFAPVATRFATYGIALSDAAMGYVEHILALPLMRQWRALGIAQDVPVPRYDKPLPPRPFPGPERFPAQALDGHHDAENTACPYSGKPVTHFAEINGRVFGFCNAVCRDKTVADPSAWPDFRRLHDL